MDSAPNLSVLKVHLQVSKCDQFGRGVDVYVGKASPLRCPVVAVVSYMAMRGQQPGLFFRRQSGKPLTKPQFIAEVKKALTAAGLDHGPFSGHSFRIGAATAAAQAGIPDSAIQTLGRWNNAAFLSYIRTPRQKLASLTSSVMQ